MKDRIPMYPGRVMLIPVSGQENIYDMTRADQPEQEGTPLNKASLLTDETAEAIGLSGDPTVNEALSKLMQNIPTAILNVHSNAGIVVTATKDSTVLSATTNDEGLAVFHFDKLGIWTLEATINNTTVSMPYDITGIAIFDVYITTNLETASWEVISAISEAGQASTIWSIGDTKTIKINDISYTVQIIGFNHDTKDSGGKAGITFQLMNCLDYKDAMNGENKNDGGWKTSLMRNSILPGILIQMDENLQKAIKSVTKKYGIGNTSPTINIVSDKLFLLSEIEIFGKSSKSGVAEGSQYAWYQAGNSKIKQINGSNDSWWERSASIANSNTFCVVRSTEKADTSSAAIPNGIAFGFCV